MPSWNPNGVVTIEVGPSGGAPSSILVLPVNPDQNFTQDYRVTVVQTISGIYTDDFGIGISNLQLSGTSGFRALQGKFNGNPVDGNTAIFNLNKNIINYYFTREANIKGSTVMTIYDDSFGRAWQVKPIQQLQLQRVSSAPLVVNYSCSFVVLKDFQMNLPNIHIPDPIQAVWQTKKSVQQQSQSRVASASTLATSVKQTPTPVYEVQNGDSLWAIAKMYLPTNATNIQIQALVDKITSTNGLRNPNLIFKGEVLKIPA